MDLILNLTILSICIVSIFIAYLDITTRKVKNVYLLLLFLLSIVFILTTKPIISNYLLLIIIIPISILFHNKKIWGASDGKFFITSSLIVLSLGELFHFLEFIVNSILLFTLGSFLVGITSTSKINKKLFFLNIPFKLLLFQSLLIIAFSTLAYNLLSKVISNSFIFLLIIIIIVFIVNTISKKIYHYFENNTNYVISFASFCYGFYSLLFIYFVSLLLLFAIKMSIHYISNITISGLESKNNDSITPITAYFSFSLILQFIINNSLITYMILLF